MNAPAKRTVHVLELAQFLYRHPGLIDRGAMFEFARADIVAMVVELANAMLPDLYAHGEIQLYTHDLLVEIIERTEERCIPLKNTYWILEAQCLALREEVLDVAYVLAKQLVRFGQRVRFVSIVEQELLVVEVYHA